MNTFDKSYTVYVPDLLGYGKSDCYENIAGTRFYDIHIDCLRQLAERLELSHFGLAGLSIGGAIAIGYALRYPDYVDYLISVSSWGLSRQMPFHKFSYWYVHKTNLTLMQYRWCARSRMLARWSIAYALIGNKKNITDMLIDEVMDSCKGGHAGRSMLDFQRSSATKEQAIPYYDESLTKLCMLVALVIGEKDPLVPLRDVQAAHKKLAGSKLYIFEGCKHWTVKEQPERFCQIVCELTENI